MLVYSNFILLVTMWIWMHVVHFARGPLPNSGVGACPRLTSSMTRVISNTCQALWLITRGRICVSFNDDVANYTAARITFPWRYIHAHLFHSNCASSLRYALQVYDFAKFRKRCKDSSDLSGPPVQSSVTFDTDVSSSGFVYACFILRS